MAEQQEHSIEANKTSFKDVASALVGVLFLIGVAVNTFKWISSDSPEADNDPAVISESTAVAVTNASLPANEPVEQKTEMYYVVEPFTTVCRDFKDVLRVESMVQMRNEQALQLILSRTQCQILLKEVIMPSHTTIRSMPSGVLVADLPNGMFFFAGRHMSEEHLTPVEARRRIDGAMSR